MNGECISGLSQTYCTQYSGSFTENAKDIKTSNNSIVMVCGDSGKWLKNRLSNEVVVRRMMKGEK